MRRPVLIAILLSTVPAFAQTVPFAESPNLGQPPPLERLSEIMGSIQVGHSKLWQAIHHKNWDLINYEAGKIKDSFSNAVIFYRNIPVELIVAAATPLNTIQNAAVAKDAAKLEPAFREFTAACNGCHQAAQVGFVVIKQPNSAPFDNQDFAPSRR